MLGNDGIAACARKAEGKASVGRNDEREGTPAVAVWAEGRFRR